MLTALLLANAFAADLHVEVSTPKWSDDYVKAAGEPFTARSGVINEGKKQTAYEVIWSPSPHNPVENGYQMEITICRIWAKGKKKERDCVTETLFARPESAERDQVAGEVKGSDKWSYRISAYATGDDIPSTALPMEADEPEAEPEPTGNVETP